MPPSPAAHERDQKQRSATQTAASPTAPPPAPAPVPASVSPSPSPAPVALAPASTSASAPTPAPPSQHHQPTATPPPEIYEESGQLENLNENQLRALLDEAVTYKRPKDREGKSSLFKNLLYKAEQASEEELHLGFGLGGSIGINTGKRNRAKRSLTHFPHSGSLQDLAVAGNGPDIRLPRPHNRHRRPVPVSARSLHGGSLPANVDQQYFGTFLEDVRCNNSVGIKPRVSGNDYIATVKCINPPPLGEQTSTSDYMVLSVANNESDRIPSPPINHPVSSSPQPTYISGYYGDDDDGTEMDYIRPQKNSHIPSYTSRTTLEIVSPSMTGEAAADRNPNVLNLVDTNLGCITSPVISQPPPPSVLEPKPLQLGSGYCSVRSVTAPTSIDGNGSGNSGASATFPVMPNLNVINILQSQSHQFQHESDKKSLDENFNAVQNLSSITGTSQSNPKKSKRKKSHKNETQTLAQYIDGYRGDKEIDDIMKFIESDADNVKNHGIQSKSNTGLNINGKVSSSRDSKSKDDNENDKSNKKRSTERRMKDKLETKLKRANSMEELSRRKFDDFTPNKDSSFRKSKKSSILESNSMTNGKNNERRSWCNEESEPYYKSDKNDSDEPSSLDIIVSASNNTLSSKQKKTKQSTGDIDMSIVDCDPFYAFETSDFQTVTKKKKIRKRHSPTDEGRNRSNFYNHNIQNVRTTNGGRSVQERDTLYKRLGNGTHPSVSSPPSDKSNDSNDDLDSIHSLPADASGERFQASYADMARAAPPVSPPPIIPPVSRQHNFPDLIESCNYYTNDVSVQDKHLDISIENTKNLLLKENSAELDKRSLKTNSLDFGHQPDLSVHKAYIREQYPALETRQRINNKMSIKTKVDTKIHNKICNEKQSDVLSLSKGNDNNKNKEEMLSNNTATACKDASSDKYPKISENNNINDPDSEKNSNSIIKIDSNLNKPPDVVLPLAEISQTFDSRPAVIIMNEEPNRSSNDIHNINGITFGFDINEQLINGESNLESEISNAIEYSVSCSNTEVTNSLCTPIYNSNIDFPAINEKPFRESGDKSKHVNDDSKHSKKSNRPIYKESVKLANKHNSLDTEVHDVNSLKSEESGGLTKDEETLSVGQVVETCVGKDKALRYLAPTATSKDIYNLDKIVHYVGMAWENIIKTSGDKIRYFSDQQ